MSSLTSVSINKNQKRFAPQIKDKPRARPRSTRAAPAHGESLPTSAEQQHEKVDSSAKPTTINSQLGPVRGDSPLPHSPKKRKTSVTLDKTPAETDQVAHSDIVALPENSSLLHSSRKREASVIQDNTTKDTHEVVAPDAAVLADVEKLIRDVPPALLARPDNDATLSVPQPLEPQDKHETDDLLQQNNLQPSLIGMPCQADQQQQHSAIVPHPQPTFGQNQETAMDIPNNTMSVNESDERHENITPVDDRWMNMMEQTLKAIEHASERKWAKLKSTAATAREKKNLEQYWMKYQQEERERKRNEEEAEKKAFTRSDAPQVKLVNGEIVLDEDSLERPIQDPPQTEEEITPQIVEESSSLSASDVRNQYDRVKRKRWTKAETERFYEGIQMYGLDFGQIATLFPDRDQKSVKIKYLYEEKWFPWKINDYIFSHS
ncbi:uncharacterized protein BYT42DRAFT_572980 [Radiomyces spectabilis]|uniref:uncharacterized protein n=1 Tax=Radiomyces spectabilis TaxID=64574 RepID=UPI00221F6C92|nr:uncharacterized protein BYT42DRAFT_572980 [Radiomyces spectabilis]KAI8375983.1 hypothetical protein BYT42DRAFT_572980 [Radiomyces spectabilis]